jgi:NADPH:quinone reductase-like Zn-dependent oxidoreductase
LGADVAINYRTEDFAESVQSLTEGRGVDVILDMVGGAYIVRNLRSLAVEGRLVQIAFLQGSKVELDFRRVLMNRLTITGSTLRPRTVAQKAEIARALQEKIWPLLESGKVRPLIHKIFPLHEASAAHRMMEASTHTGKLILIIGAEA